MREIFLRYTAVAFLMLSALMSAAQDKTLRVDYIFSGTDRSVDISLDEMSCFDGWAGRRTNLDSVAVRGNGQICMKDVQTGEILYCQSFSSLFQEWQTTEEATMVRKAFENVFLLPMPSAKAVVSIELYDFWGSVYASLNHEVDPSDILIRQIDPAAAPTFYVYSLIHTLSHLLIRSAAGLCGLDKNSISEYVLPGVPAVLVYCQNSQGFNLGALFNIFEAYFDKWIENAYNSAKKCIFDPVCIERYKACTGCLFLNEVSCQHFNHDLDRSLVIGSVDRANSTRYWGFWEE